MVGTRARVCVCMGVYVVGNVVKILLDSVCMFGHSTVWMDVVSGERAWNKCSLCVMGGLVVNCMVRV